MDSPAVLRLKLDRVYYPASPSRFSIGKRTPAHPVAALSGFSLYIEPGERVILLGPSGSGKSTLLKIAAGRHVCFEGQRRAVSGPIGYMPQEPCLLPWLTVEQNIRRFCQSAGVRPDAGAYLCRRLGLEELTGRYPAALSGGQYRRAMLVRTLALSPRLLLLDEPFVGLDQDSLAQAVDTLADFLPSVGSALLLATHHPEMIKKLGGSRILLQERPAAPTGEEAGVSKI